MTDFIDFSNGRKEYLELLKKSFAEIADGIGFLKHSKAISDFDLSKMDQVSRQYLDAWWQNLKKSMPKGNLLYITSDEQNQSSQFAMAIAKHIVKNRWEIPIKMSDDDNFDDTHFTQVNHVDWQYYISVEAFDGEYSFDEWSQSELLIVTNLDNFPFITNNGSPFRLDKLMSLVTRLAAGKPTIITSCASIPTLHQAMQRGKGKDYSSDPYISAKSRSIIGAIKEACWSFEVVSPHYEIPKGSTPASFFAAKPKIHEIPDWFKRVSDKEVGETL